MIPAHEIGVGDCWPHFTHSQEPESEQDARPGVTAPKFAPANPNPPSSKTLPPEAHTNFPNSITKGQVFKHGSPTAAELAPGAAHRQF